MGLDPTIYATLRAIAQTQMNQERSGHTLTATALVHEAFMRLGATDNVRDRAGFLRAAAEAMRRILVEHARSKARVKRGGRITRISLDSIGDVAAMDMVDDDGAGFFAFDSAFERLQAHDESLADVVRLRFFAGLGVAETAAALSISERTVNYRWVYARAWLARDIRTSEAAAAADDANNDPRTERRG